MLKILIFQEVASCNSWNFCCWNQNSGYLQDKSAIECTFSLYRKVMSGLKMPEIWANWAKVERSTRAIACFVFLCFEPKTWAPNHSNTERRSTRFSVIGTSAERKRTKRRFCSFLAIVVPTSGFNLWNSIRPHNPHSRTLCTVLFLDTHCFAKRLWSC